MKQVGIAVDNYKIDKFKKALAELGYTEVEVSPLFEKSSLLSVQVPDDKVHDVHRLCIKLQTDFNRSN